MKPLYALLLLCFSVFSFKSSAKSWSIDVVADGFTGEQAYLAYYLGSSQYILDTADLVQGKFHFTGEDIEPGVYMVVFPPDNTFFQIMVSAQDKDILIKVNMENVNRPYLIKGSPETTLFYEYVDYLQEKRPYADSLRKLSDTLQDETRKVQIAEELQKIDKDVKEYQSNLVKKHPGTLTALLINSNTEIDVPDFEGETEDVQMQTYLYVKQHYFDNVPLDDPRIVRTPVLNQKIDYYVNKLTPQVPDSLNNSIDFILSRLDTAGEAFKVYLVHFLNQFARSNIVGMDAVYVHLVENYYAKGYATWTDSEQLDKIIKNAETLEPLLIGKPAPDLLMLTRDNTALHLYDVSSPFVVLFFWDPECGHCKKSMPLVIDFYNKYKPKGVEVFSVCTRLQDDVAKCWDFIDSHEGMELWVNVVDPYLRSRFKQVYDVRNTPQIYILDKDKKIVMKKIGAEQLPEVMDKLLESGS